jgi:hypothetical protein
VECPLLDDHGARDRHVRVAGAQNRQMSLQDVPGAPTVSGEREATRVKKAVHFAMTFVRVHMTNRSTGYLSRRPSRRSRTAQRRRPVNGWLPGSGRGANGFNPGPPWPTGDRQFSVLRRSWAMEMVTGRAGLGQRLSVEACPGWESATSAKQTLARPRRHPIPGKPKYGSHAV